MGKQDGYSDAVIGRGTRSSPLFLLAVIANLPEIELAFGHQARLRAFERLRDILRRFFGDEEYHEVENFGLIEVIIRPNSEQTLDHPDLLIGQLCALICASPIFSESEAFFAVPSIGAAMLEAGDANLETARTQAYKQVQSRSIHSYRSLEASKYRDDMIKAVRLLEQVASGHARLLWQPTVASTPGSPVLYYEGLLRIRDVDGNFHACGRDLRALEKTDLSPELDRRLMALALDELDADPTLRLGINISARSTSLHRYGRNALWGELRNRLSRKPSLAHRLVIEITETADFASLEEASEFVCLMQRLGCLIAIDDFGAGRGSIIQLSALAVDIIKIDGNFIQSASQSDRGYATFLHLVRLGTSLASTVVVEGIENSLQADLARKAGAHWLQGYQFGRPSADRILPMTDDRGITSSLESLGHRSAASQENSTGHLGTRL